MPIYDCRLQPNLIIVEPRPAPDCVLFTNSLPPFFGDPTSITVDEQYTSPFDFAAQFIVQGAPLVESPQLYKFLFMPTLDMRSMMLWVNERILVTDANGLTHELTELPQIYGQVYPRFIDDNVEPGAQIQLAPGGVPSPLFNTTLFSTQVDEYVVCETEEYRSSLLLGDLGLAAPLFHDKTSDSLTSSIGNAPLLHRINTATIQYGSGAFGLSGGLLTTDGRIASVDAGADAYAPPAFVPSGVVSADYMFVDFLTVLDFCFGTVDLINSRYEYTAYRYGSAQDPNLSSWINQRRVWVTPTSFGYRVFVVFRDWTTTTTGGTITHRLGFMDFTVEGNAVVLRRGGWAIFPDFVYQVPSGFGYAYTTHSYVVSHTSKQSILGVATAQSWLSTATNEILVYGVGSWIDFDKTNMRQINSCPPTISNPPSYIELIQTPNGFPCIVVHTALQQETVFTLSSSLPVLATGVTLTTDGGGSCTDNAGIDVCQATSLWIPTSKIPL